MSSGSESVAFLTVLFEQRLAALTSETFGSKPDYEGLIHALAAAQKNTDAGMAWHLISGVAGTFPPAEVFERFFEKLLLVDQNDHLDLLLKSSLMISAESSGFRKGLELLENEVLVDVTFSAQTGHNTGIQRVVRNVSQSWVRYGKSVRFVVWNENSDSYRNLLPEEADRLLGESKALYSYATTEARSKIILPLHSVLLCIEVPQLHQASRMRCITQYSSNRVIFVGHDMIPALSPEFVDVREAERFAHYLSVIKHASLVISVSNSAANEFRGFVSSLRAQGIVGPEVTAIPLAIDSPVLSGSASAHFSIKEASKPLVLMVGSIEARKNQMAVLNAAHHLWKMGKVFTLRFIGSGSSANIRKLKLSIKRLGQFRKNVELVENASDAILADSFARARFSVFPSLHEGFGLPVAESIAAGIPVITSFYGSTAEIAEPGGAVLINPRNNQELSEAMARLLEDDQMLLGLQSEAAARSQKTWGEYSLELWERVTNEIPERNSEGMHSGKLD